MVCARVLVSQFLAECDFNLENPETETSLLSYCQGIFIRSKLFPVLFPATTVRMSKIGVIFWIIYIFLLKWHFGFFMFLMNMKMNYFFNVMAWSGTKSDKIELRSFVGYYRTFSSSLVSESAIQSVTEYLGMRFWMKFLMIRRHQFYMVGTIRVERH